MLTREALLLSAADIAVKMVTFAIRASTFCIGIYLSFFMMFGLVRVVLHGVRYNSLLDISTVMEYAILSTAFWSIWYFTKGVANDVRIFLKAIKDEQHCKQLIS